MDNRDITAERSAQFSLSQEQIAEINAYLEELGVVIRTCAAQMAEALRPAIEQAIEGIKAFWRALLPSNFLRMYISKSGRSPGLGCRPRTRYSGLT